MQGVNTEMKALKRYLKIVEPLTTNIKELDRLVKEMKITKNKFNKRLFMYLHSSEGI